MLSRLFTLFISLIVISPRALATTPNCPAGGPMSADQFSEVLAAQKAAELDASKDLKSFCAWNRMTRASFQKSAAADVKEAKASGDQQKAAAALRESVKNETAPWQISMYGDPSLKTAALKKTALYTPCADGKGSCRASFGDVRDQLAKPFPKSNVPYELDEFQKGSSISTVAPLRAALCSKVSGQVMGCSSALGSVLETMTPYHAANGTVVIPGKTVYDVATNPEYTEGLRRTFIKMQNRMADPVVTKGANLFDDVLSSFKESGMTGKAAEDAAWETLGALAASGPNMGARLSGYDHTNLKDTKGNPNKIALIAIAESIPFLDSVMISQNTPSLYSLPAGVSFPCDSGKDYHFWMAAYLTRKLVKEGYSSKDARAASFTAQVGYNLYGDIGGIGGGDSARSESRNPNNLGNFSRYEATENGFRMDLNLGSAGARFGADQANGKTDGQYDVQKGFQDSLASGGVQPAGYEKSWYLPNRISSGLQWMENMNVKSIYQEFNP